MDLDTRLWLLPAAWEPDRLHLRAGTDRWEGPPGNRAGNADARAFHRPPATL